MDSDGWAAIAVRGTTKGKPKFVEDEAGFEAVKAQSLRIGDVKTFEGFIVDVPASADIEQYNTVLVWCESFGEFITALKYK